MAEKPKSQKAREETSQTHGDVELVGVDRIRWNVDEVPLVHCSSTTVSSSSSSSSSTGSGNGVTERDARCVCVTHQPIDRPLRAGGRLCGGALAGNGGDNGSGDGTPREHGGAASTRVR